MDDGGGNTWKPRPSGSKPTRSAGAAPTQCSISPRSTPFRRRCARACCAAGSTAPDGDREPGLAALDRIAELALSREGAAEVAIEGARVVREYATLKLMTPAMRPAWFNMAVRTDAAADYSDPQVRGP
jgi:hypothetical protein